MGDVYAGFDENRKLKVAIKAIQDGTQSYSSDPELKVKKTTSG